MMDQATPLRNIVKKEKIDIILFRSESPSRRDEYLRIDRSEKRFRSNGRATKASFTSRG